MNIKESIPSGNPVNEDEDMYDDEYILMKRQGMVPYEDLPELSNGVEVYKWENGYESKY